MRDQTSHYGSEHCNNFMAKNYHYIVKEAVCVKSQLFSEELYCLKYTSEELVYFTAPFSNMRTLTFKAQPTNTFFATVNQVFNDSSQLPTTVERAVLKSLSTVQITKQCSAVVGS